MATAMGDKKIPCRARGCVRTWLWRGNEQAKAAARGETATPARLCDLCQVRHDMLADRALQCPSHGCTGTFTWTRDAQLEALLARLNQGGDGQPEPPAFMCDACRDKARSLGDKPIPCRVKDCENTWLWTGKAQLAALKDEQGAAETPSRMCDRCHAAFESFRDEGRPCRVRGCKRRWTWTRWQQLDALVHGQKEPPPHMCEECAHKSAALTDREVACRTQGCAGTWNFTRAMQLEAEITGESEPPARMCPGCQSRFSHLKDMAVPCKRPGCKGTWIYKRGAQLERWAKHGDEPAKPPHRLCDACRHKLDERKDRELPCKTQGCKGTWTWTRFAQLQADEAGHGPQTGAEPPHHMCDECRTFLETHHGKTLTCTGCGAETRWASELQLKVKLGLMTEPTLCAACKRKSADQARARPVHR